MSISRRKFLVGVGAMGLATTMLSGVSYASAPTDKRLVVILLRGGMDSLAAIAPYGDKDYKKIRGDMALATDSLLKIDNMFGFHPSLKSFHNMYQNGEMVIFNNVAVPYRNRSHFDAQNVLENGLDKPYASKDGWINRLVGELNNGDYQLGMSIGRSMPLIMRGSNNVGSWSPQILPEVGYDYLSRVQNIYSGDDIFSKSMKQAIEVQEKSDELMGMDGNNKKSFSPKAFIGNAKMAGKWLADDNGPRIASLELGGWDTHANQGVEGGQLASKFEVLASGIDALKNELGHNWNKTTILCLTEFGRTVKPNGTRGTDHGTGGTSFIFGGGLKQSQIIGDWQGFSEKNLFDGRDLMPLIDTRSVIKTVISSVYGVNSSLINNNILK